MIFVTVGTHDMPFDRLLTAVDELAASIDEPITAQIGYSEYEPTNVDWFRFTEESTISRLYSEASTVVAHAGAGTILTALANGRPTVVVPRRERFDEHLDDHQLELADALEGRPDVVVVWAVERLGEAIERARSREVRRTDERGDLADFLHGYLTVP